MIKSNSYSLRLVICLVAVTVLSGHAAGQDIKKVGEGLVELTVVGQGMDKSEALREVQRKAVERGAGVYIYSQSKTENFALVKDTILARSAGYVQSRTILDEKQDDDGIWSLRVKAVVSIKGIKDAWGVTTNLLKDMGRPKIMVYIREKIGSDKVETSTVQTRIEDLLMKSGFHLVSRNQLKAIDKKDLAAAKLEGKQAKIQAIAKRFGAQLFITGTANATRGRTRTIGGVTLHRYEADANVTCYRSDSGRLLSAVPGKSTPGLARVARSAAKASLDAQAKTIAPLVRADILRVWQDALEGRNEVTLEVVELAKFLGYINLKRALAKVKGVKAVNGNLHNKVARLSIECNTTAEKLAERIAVALQDTLEISGLSQNVIKAKYTGK